MTADPSIVVVLGSVPGPLALLDDALGRRLRDQLRRHGVAWLAASTQLRAGRDLAAAAKDEQAVVRAAAGACRTLLVTAEGDPETLVEIASLVPAADLTVRLLVERQDRAVEHAMVAALRDGKPGDAFEAHDTVDHAVVVRELAGLPFVGSVGVRPYELVHGGVATWVDDVLDLVGLRGRLDLRPLVASGPPPTYRGYSAHGLDVGLALLPELTTVADRDLLHEFLLEAHPAGDQRLLSAAERDDIVVRHRETNRAFFVDHLPDLPPDSYGDDAATALLAQVPVSVRVPRPAPQVVARRLARRLRAIRFRR